MNQRRGGSQNIVKFHSRLPKSTLAVPVNCSAFNIQDIIHNFTATDKTTLNVNACIFINMREWVIENMINLFVGSI